MLDSLPAARTSWFNMVNFAPAMRADPSWLLGLDDHPVLRGIDVLPNDGSGLVEYVRGLRALVARDYVGAAAYLTQSEQRHFLAWLRATFGVGPA